MEKGYYVQVLVKAKNNAGHCPFTTTGHFITLVKLNDNGKVLVYDSKEENINKNELKYEEGFELSEIVPWITSYLVIDSQFRDDGYDYTQLPEIDESRLQKYYGNERDATLLAEEGIRVSEWITTEDAVNSSRC